MKPDRNDRRTPTTTDGLEQWIETVESEKDATNPVPGNAYGSWLLRHDRADQPEPGDGDLVGNWSSAISHPGEVVNCPITGRSYHVAEDTLTELWTHAASSLYFVSGDLETEDRRRRLREHVIDAWLSATGPEYVEDAVRHAAHYIASHPPDKDDTASEAFDPTAYEDELRALVPVAQEWLIEHENDPDLLG